MRPIQARRILQRRKRSSRHCALLRTTFRRRSHLVSSPHSTTPRCVLRPRTKAVGISAIINGNTEDLTFGRAGKHHTSDTNRPPQKSRDASVTSSPGTHFAPSPSKGFLPIQGRKMRVSARNECVSPLPQPQSLRADERESWDGLGPAYIYIVCTVHTDTHTLDDQGVCETTCMGTTGLGSGTVYGLHGCSHSWSLAIKIRRGPSQCRPVPSCPESSRNHNSCSMIIATTLEQPSYLILGAGSAGAIVNIVLPFGSESLCTVLTPILQ